ncbi:hypothetical protein, partial [Actinomadura sp. 7K534]|uniref:hypothetical protein n=1 Tax=Actinomadura sp. 7K534 TaxID=2530366 RepID=UPI001A9FBBF2
LSTAPTPMGRSTTLRRRNAATAQDRAATGQSSDTTATHHATFGSPTTIGNSTALTRASTANRTTTLTTSDATPARHRTTNGSGDAGVAHRAAFNRATYTVGCTAVLARGTTALARHNRPATGGSNSADAANRATSVTTSDAATSRHHTTNGGSSHTSTTQPTFSRVSTTLGGSANLVGGSAVGGRGGA